MKTGFTRRKAAFIICMAIVLIGIYATYTMAARITALMRKQVGDGQSAADAPATVNKGILAYDSNRQIYIGFEFFADAMTDEQFMLVSA